MRIGFIFLFLLLFFTQLKAQTYQDYFKVAVKAYEAKNYKLMLNETRKAHRIRPHHQTLIYYLSMAYALNSEVDSANYWLHKLITIDAGNYDINREDFNYIKQSAGFGSVKAYQEFMNASVTRSDTALMIPDSQMHIEDVVFDSLNSRYLISSINKRNIFSVENNQIKQLFQKNFPLGITGMEVQGNTLWFTAAGFPEAGIPADDARLETSMLYQMDLKKEALLDSFSISDAQSHLFGDVLITDNHEVFVSDSKANKIYILKGKKLVEWFYSDQIFSLQGVAQKGDHFFLADYSQGLFHYNRTNKKLTVIQPAENLALKGIDGLYAFQDGLIAIQNGVIPHRVTYLQLDDSSDQVERFQYLEKNHPAMGEPTLGFITNKQLHYVANSFWGLNKNGKINNPENIQPIILSLPLMEIKGL